MTDHALVAVLVVLTSLTVLGILALHLRAKPFDEQRLQASLQAELRAARQEAALAAKESRAELQAGLKQHLDAVLGGTKELREAYMAAAQEQRDALAAFSKGQEERFRQLQESFDRLIQSTGEAGERLRESLAQSVKSLQEGNERKLEEMRVTVDEKLQGTLEKRLGESFTLVSERLEAVQRGLGEMQALATGVGDLKKVLTNVKTRGTFGEYQLRAILEQILSPEQYQENFAPKRDAGERVEFAIVLPGRDLGEPVYLPIDSKFPQEDYLRLVDASERSDPEAMAMARDGLCRGMRAYAKDVSTKYIAPPATTDFALIFLPTEGLYAEVLRQPGLVGELQTNHSIVIAGPTTFAALLNSLRMGFRTLALEKRSSEVWQVLGAVKTEFGKFGKVLDKVKTQLNKATNTLDETSTRTRAMERRLREVESLPADLSSSLIGLDGRILGAGADLAPDDEDLHGDDSESAT